MCVDRMRVGTLGAGAAPFYCFISGRLVTVNLICTKRLLHVVGQVQVKIELHIRIHAHAHTLCMVGG